MERNFRITVVGAAIAGASILGRQTAINRFDNHINHVSAILQESTSQGYVTDLDATRYLINEYQDFQNRDLVMKAAIAGGGIVAGFGLSRGLGKRG